MYKPQPAIAPHFLSCFVPHGVQSARVQTNSASYKWFVSMVYDPKSKGPPLIYTNLGSRFNLTTPLLLLHLLVIPLDKHAPVVVHYPPKTASDMTNTSSATNGSFPNIKLYLSSGLSQLFIHNASQFTAIVHPSE